MNSGVYEIDAVDSFSATSDTSIDAAILEVSREFFIHEQAKILLQIEETRNQANNDAYSSNTCPKSSRSSFRTFLINEVPPNASIADQGNPDQSMNEKLSTLIQDQQNILETINSQLVLGDKPQIMKQSEHTILRVSDELNEHNLRQEPGQGYLGEHNQRITAIEFSNRNRFYDDENTTFVSKVSIGSNSKAKITNVNILGTRHVYDAVDQQSDELSSSSMISIVVVVCPVCETCSKINYVKDPKNKETKPLFCVSCGSVSPIDACKVLKDTSERIPQVSRSIHRKPV